MQEKRLSLLRSMRRWRQSEEISQYRKLRHVKELARTDIEASLLISHDASVYA